MCNFKSNPYLTSFLHVVPLSGKNCDISWSLKLGVLYMKWSHPPTHSEDSRKRRRSGKVANIGYLKCRQLCLFYYVFAAPIWGGILPVAPIGDEMWTHSTNIGFRGFFLLIAPTLLHYITLYIATKWLVFIQCISALKMELTTTCLYLLPVC